MLRHRYGRALRRATAAVRVVAVLRRALDLGAVVHRQRARADLDAGLAGHFRTVVHRHVRVAVERDARVDGLLAGGVGGIHRAVHHDVDAIARTRQVAEHEHHALHRAADGHVNVVGRRVVRAEDVQAVAPTLKRHVLADGQRALRRRVVRIREPHVDRGHAGIRGRDDAALLLGVAVDDGKRPLDETQAVRRANVLAVQVEREVAVRLVLLGQRGVREERHRRVGGRVRRRPGLAERRVVRRLGRIAGRSNLRDRRRDLVELRVGVVRVRRERVARRHAVGRRVAEQRRARRVDEARERREGVVLRVATDRLRVLRDERAVLDVGRRRAARIAARVDHERVARRVAAVAVVAVGHRAAVARERAAFHSHRAALRVHGRPALDLAAVDRHGAVLRVVDRVALAVCRVTRGDYLAAVDRHRRARTSAVAGNTVVRALHRAAVQDERGRAVRGVVALRRQLNRAVQLAIGLAVRRRVDHARRLGAAVHHRQRAAVVHAQEHVARRPRLAGRRRDRLAREVEIDVAAVLDRRHLRQRQIGQRLDRAARRRVVERLLQRLVLREDVALAVDRLHHIVLRDDLVQHRGGGRIHRHELVVGRDALRLVLLAEARRVRVAVHKGRDRDLLVLGRHRAVERAARHRGRDARRGRLRSHRVDFVQRNAARSRVERAAGDVHRDRLLSRVLRDRNRSAIHRRAAAVRLDRQLGRRLLDRAARHVQRARAGLDARRARHRAARHVQRGDAVQRDRHVARRDRAGHVDDAVALRDVAHHPDVAVDRARDVDRGTVTGLAVRVLVEDNAVLGLDRGASGQREGVIGRLGSGTAVHPHRSRQFALRLGRIRQRHVARVEVDRLRERLAIEVDRERLAVVHLQVLGAVFEDLYRLAILGCVNRLRQGLVLLRAIALADLGHVVLRNHVVHHRVGGGLDGHELVVLGHAVGRRVREQGRVRAVADLARDDRADGGRGLVDLDRTREGAALQRDRHASGIAVLRIDHGHGRRSGERAALDFDGNRLARGVLRHRDRRALRRAAAEVRLVAVRGRRRRDRAAVHRQRARAHLDARVAADFGVVVDRHVGVAVERNTHVDIVALSGGRHHLAVHDDVDRVLGVLQVAEHEQRPVHRAVHRHVDHVLLCVVRAEHVQAVRAGRAVERHVLANGQRALARQVARAAHLDRSKAGAGRRNRALARDVEAAARQRDVARARDVLSVQVELDSLVLARRRVAVVLRIQHRCRAGIHEQTVRQLNVLEQFHRVAVRRRLECLVERLVLLTGRLAREHLRHVVLRDDLVQHRGGGRIHRHELVVGRDALRLVLLAEARRVRVAVHKGRDRDLLVLGRHRAVERAARHRGRDARRGRLRSHRVDFVQRNAARSRVERAAGDVHRDRLLSRVLRDRNRSAIHRRAAAVRLDRQLGRRLLDRAARHVQRARAGLDARRARHRAARHVQRGDAVQRDRHAARRDRAGHVDDAVALLDVAHHPDVAVDRAGDVHRRVIGRALRGHVAQDHAVLGRDRRALREREGARHAGVVRVQAVHVHAVLDRAVPRLQRAVEHVQEVGRQLPAVKVQDDVPAAVDCDRLPAHVLQELHRRRRAVRRNRLHRLRQGSEELGRVLARLNHGDGRKVVRVHCRLRTLRPGQVAGETIIISLEDANIVVLLDVVARQRNLRLVREVVAAQRLLRRLALHDVVRHRGGEVDVQGRLDVDEALLLHAVSRIVLKGVSCDDNIPAGDRRRLNRVPVAIVKCAARNRERAGQFICVKGGKLVLAIVDVLERGVLHRAASRVHRDGGIAANRLAIAIQRDAGLEAHIARIGNVFEELDLRIGRRGACSGRKCGIIGIADLSHGRNERVAVGRVTGERPTAQRREVET